MAENSGYYTAHPSYRIAHGNNIGIECSVNVLTNVADISHLTALSQEDLQGRRDKSVAMEKTYFEIMCKAATEWAAHAADTQMIDMAAEYLKAPAVEHSANQWHANQYGNQEISNMVYRMYYVVREDKEYDRESKTLVPASWNLKWRVSTNTPVKGHAISLDGQNNKRFTDKAAMEKYLQGRIKAFSHLFTEISPPIPKGQEHRYSVNGKLLPGYSVQGQERPSALDTLAAAKEAVKSKGADKPPVDKKKDKSHGEEI